MLSERLFMIENDIRGSDPSIATDWSEGKRIQITTCGKKKKKISQHSQTFSLSERREIKKLGMLFWNLAELTL